MIQFLDGAFLQQLWADNAYSSAAFGGGSCVGRGGGVNFMGGVFVICSVTVLVSIGNLDI